MTSPIIKNSSDCKLICFPDAVPSVEWCDFVAVDKQLNIIRECFFISPRFKDVTQVNKKYIDETQENQIAAGYLCYSNNWSLNFQHFLQETLPKMVTYKNDVMNAHTDVPILLPPTLNNRLAIDLLDLLEIPKEKRMWLEKESTYHVSKLFYSQYEPVHVSDYPFNCLKLVNHLCEALPHGGNSNVYVSRNEKQDLLNNNNAAGLKRVLSNEDDLVSSLEPYDFSCLHLGSTSIREKVSLLSQAETIIVPAGAGVMNIVFTRHLKHLIILGSGSGQYMIDNWIRLCNYIHTNCKCSYIPPTTAAVDDGTSNLHKPFTIDPRPVIEAVISEVK